MPVKEAEENRENPKTLPLMTLITLICTDQKSQRGSAMNL